MSIIASAPVPAGSRLIDADTINLTAIRRPLLAGDDRYAEGYADGLNRALTARPAACPPWCSHDHRADVDEVDGFSIGLVHERIIAELVAVDGVSVNDPATATVLVESTTEAGVTVAPARVVLTVAEGAEGGYPGSEGVLGWTGTPEQAEQLADALMIAAETIRVLRRAAR